jgi:hypothetical protein
MVWNKPRNLWQWLLLLTPAVLAIGAVHISKRWMPPIPPLHLTNGRVIADVGRQITRISLISLAVIAVVSFVIAVVLSRGAAFGQRIVNVVFFTLCLLLVNSFVAFGGCAIIGAPNPDQYELVPARADTSDGNGAGDYAAPPDKLPPTAR